MAMKKQCTRMNCSPKLNQFLFWWCFGIELTHDFLFFDNHGWIWGQNSHSIHILPCHDLLQLEIEIHCCGLSIESDAHKILRLFFSPFILTSNFSTAVHFYSDSNHQFQPNHFDSLTFIILTSESDTKIFYSKFFHCFFFNLQRKKSLTNDSFFTSK